MAVNLVKELLRLNRMVGEENIQAIVEGDIVVPDSKPDISRVLSVKSKVNISDKEIIQGKVMVDGIVNFEILYTCQGGDQPVHNMNASAGFSEGIEIQGIDSTMYPEATFVLEHVDFKVMNERKMSVKAILKLVARVVAQKETDVIQGLEDIENAQVLNDVVEYDNPVGNNNAQSVLRETYELGEDTPEIHEILDTNGAAVVEEARVTDGKVIVGGIANIKILFATEEPRNPVCEVKHEIPFTQFVEVPKALNDMICNANVEVSDIYTEVKSNIEELKKVYDIEAVVKVKVKVYNREQKKILLDAYCPTRKLKLVKENLEYMKNSGCNSSQTVVKETMDVPEDLPNIFKVFTVDAKAMVTDYRLVEDKNVIEGFINGNVVYIGDTEEMTVHSFNQEIPFRHYIDMPGAKDGMVVDIEAEVNDINYSMMNSKQVEVKFNLNIESCLQEKCFKDIVIDVEDLGEVEEEDRASITVYFVQKGDTLWEVAKRYNATVKEILEANDIPDPDNIMPGDHIIIQKNYEYKL